MPDRAVWGTRQHRAADVVSGDVTRDRFGKWGTVETTTKDGHYITLHFAEAPGSEITHRKVALVPVQHAKPS